MLFLFSYFCLFGHKLPLCRLIGHENNLPHLLWRLWEISEVGFLSTEHSQTLARFTCTQRTAVWTSEDPRRHEPETTHWHCVRLLEQYERNHDRQSRCSQPPTGAMTHWCSFLRHMQSRQFKKIWWFLKTRSVIFLFVWMNAYAIKLSPYLFFSHAGTGWPQGWRGGGRVWLTGLFFFFFSPFSSVHLWALREQHCQERCRPICDLTAADTLVGSSCEQTTLLLPLLQPLHQSQSHTPLPPSGKCLLVYRCSNAEKENICTCPGLISSQPIYLLLLICLQPER